ncbi:hypothetical protein AB6A40_001477 [Gnathostoma spinigerum]|uniref:Uncharacterized protein n=1 Tax=Gnathostoma spinigerum TaxID=75299 RepID=A0ABD6E488_9BILA
MIYRKSQRKFDWTRKRLRTENRLLRQRIDYLEAESAALADRLIKDAHRRLEDAYETIRELSCRNRDALVETGTQVDDTSMIEHIHSLQQELIVTRAREADNENLQRDLKQRIQELELANKRLKERPPDHGIASLQEELISVKMREAEASLSLKEMRQRLSELEQQWAAYIRSRTPDKEVTHAKTIEHSMSVPTQSEPVSEPQSSGQGVPLSVRAQQTALAFTPQSARQRLAKLASLIGGSVADSESNEEGGLTIQELEDQLMGLRIREADTLAELKEMRQKVMELETQNHVCTNQLKRQDEELKRIRNEQDASLEKEKALNHIIQEERRKAIEAESELKEQSVMQRIKHSEAMQSIAELKQILVQLELKRAEKWTHSQLRGSSVCDFDDDSVSSQLGALGSRQSVTSGDALSVDSDDMAALIADMTVRISDMAEDMLDEPGEGDGSATETEDHHFKLRLHEEDGNDTTDSGIGEVSSSVGKLRDPKVIKEIKGIKDNKLAKKVKEVKDDEEEVKECKETKEAKKAKEVKEVKEAKEVTETKEVNLNNSADGSNVGLVQHTIEN